MQALVHFAVGISGALVLLSFIDWPPQREFLAMFLSGIWAMIPDGHWLLREFGINGPATAWRSVHQTVFADIFWFHHLIDSMETGRNNLEAGISLLLLLTLVFGYYRYNDWTTE
jgi:hypothetical protein